jgi:acyl-CoA reductase-like NAD-dependent aldehyde dehydrogenase
MTAEKSKFTEVAQWFTAADLIKVSPLVDGRIIGSEADQALTTYNPASGTELSETPIGCVADANKAVESARRSYIAGAWRRAAPSAKKVTLSRWANLIERNAVRLDALDALEMGKPIGVQAFNAASAAALLRFSAEALDKFGGDVFTSDRFSTVIQKRVPRGVIAAVVPWNFPTYNILLKVAPALAAGNSVVLKPSELASQAALVLAKLALEAGLPPGILNVVPGRGDTVGKALAEHMDVDMVTFTGSTAVGKLILQYAGRSNMKVVSAECGGKSPQIVFDDGLDLDMVAANVARMIALNQGQVCSVGSRLLVQDTIEDVLVPKIVSQLKLIVAGDPQLPSTTYGPLVSTAQLDKVLAYIAAGTVAGADLVHGGSRLLLQSGGYFIEPAVFVNVPEPSRIAREEIFGPVLSVLRFRDIEDAIRIANDTCYGLAAYAWTSRMATGFRLANAINAGYTLINAIDPIGEGPGMSFSGEPFGLSGVGIEGGVAGLETYMRRQTQWFNHG